MNLRYFPDVLAFFIGLAAQWSLYRSVAPSRWVQAWFAAGTAWMAAGFLFSAPAMAQLLPYSFGWEWLRGMAIVYAIGITFYACIRHGFSRANWVSNPMQPTRREALAAVVPAAFTGYGVFIEPNQMRFTETKIVLPGLAHDLDGLKIVQITDIHYGPYFRRRELERAIAMANEARAHLAVVTGDFISIKNDPLDECIDLVARVKSDAGMWGCLGNHEIAAECEDYAAARCGRRGIRILRGAQETLRFGKAGLNLAGVDYQRRRELQLKGAEALMRRDVPNLLLSHNPDVFPVAARQGWDLTLAGHTHGGQVNLEILGENINPARFFTPYIYGVYEQAGRQIAVSRGLGTVGAPMRAGAPPEVNLIRLVRA
jgi:uncharacterized protein